MCVYTYISNWIYISPIGYISISPIRYISFQLKSTPPPLQPFLYYHQFEEIVILVIKLIKLTNNEIDYFPQ